jgi:ABC-type molybdate transport system substrate-binding protein
MQAGIAASATAPDAAKTFIEFLASPPALPKFSEVGLDKKE